jgi:hypothetical protein
MTSILFLLEQENMPQLFLCLVILAAWAFLIAWVFMGGDE